MLGAFLLSLAMSAAATTGPDSENPLSWGVTEWWHCHDPDTASKTCSSIAKYEKIAGSRYRNDALTSLPFMPGVTMLTSMTVTVRNGSVCGTVLPAHVRSAALWREGVRLSPAQADPLIGRIAAAMSPVFGKEICTFYRPEGEELKAEIAIDGVRMAELDHRVKWIHQEDTYSVVR